MMNKNPHSTPISLLIVDDDPPVASSLRRLFKRAGFSVSVAGCGIDGIAMLTPCPQVVISDYRMPDVSGIDVLMAAQQKCPDTICVLISGYADSAELQKSMKKLENGKYFFFVAKPWDDDDFVQKVKNALQKKQSSEHHCAQGS